MGEKTEDGEAQGGWRLLRGQGEIVGEKTEDGEAQGGWRLLCIQGEIVGSRTVGGETVALLERVRFPERLVLNADVERLEAFLRCGKW